ncbi:Pentatricopeptide repeat-containing protein [Thalictrum thalictroides]|uniref:Pentatricopeptide repeat-containing protein n=1 Tax=Thalictrum thalictroides TaxID=46969 RepID=A0A7J6W1V9_THATH|nr:Pentatricopeptide repeat-containing protein [Thalictrum thalictroides]
MENHKIAPNTASFNIVLKAMLRDMETEAAEKLLERMLLTGKDSLPDDESYNLVIHMLFYKNQIDAALKYLDMTLKSGYMVSMVVFTECVSSCVDAGRLDTLVSIIKRCKEMDQNKALCPSWNLCNYIAEIALQEDDSKLAFYALEFLAKWIIRGENNTQGPPILLSVDEGLVVSALGTAGRTYNPALLIASWQILQRSLRKKSAPSPESYLGKIYAHASLGHLQKAFQTLNELESVHGSSTAEAEDLFSPFTSLYPLVLACSKKGFESLDTVYFQLESLSKADPPYKSVAALNCVVLGCANIWDLNRAYQTFEAISSSFGLTPDIHSYNALMSAFGKLKQTFEASRVFDHLVSLGVKPNETSYALLVDAHLINRDAKAAISVIDDMVTAGFKPSKVMLKKVRRRCVREFDYESDDRVEDLAKRFKIRMGTENRKGILFNIEYGANYP